MKTTISAIVLSRNDESSLEKTLNSLSFCDELIVIDDDSSDKTHEIAKKHKATVYQHALNGDFAAQRNFGLLKAKGEWVFFIDSDEVVSKELAAEIVNLAQTVIPAKAGIHSAGSPIRSGMTGCNGFLLKRRDFMWGKELKYGETANVKLLRLAKKNSGLWERPVHEVWNIQGKTEILSHPILHCPHVSVAQFLDSINFYSSLNAKYLLDQNVQSSRLRIVLNPIAKFFYNYILRLGFLDGTAGVIVALMMSFHSFLTRAKLWKLQHDTNQQMTYQ